jgi:hypothetical protein
MSPALAQYKPREIDIHATSAEGILTAEAIARRGGDGKRARDMLVAAVTVPGRAGNRK